MTIKDRFYAVYAAYPHRIPHVEGVREWAVKLATLNGVDAEGLDAAAYYHDLTKYEPKAYHVALFRDHGHPEWEHLPEFMMHGYSASLIALNDGLSAALVQAIRHHTTGQEAMTPEEKILMLADKIEPTRPYAEAKTLRAEAVNHLDVAFTSMLTYLYTYDQTHGRLNAYNLKTYRYYIPERMAE